MIDHGMEVYLEHSKVIYLHTLDHTYIHVHLHVYLERSYLQLTNQTAYYVESCNPQMVNYIIVRLAVHLTGQTSPA